MPPEIRDGMKWNVFRGVLWLSSQPVFSRKNINDKGSLRRKELAHFQIWGIMKTQYVREVIAQYRGPRRTADSIKESTTAVSFLRKVLPDNTREHFIALYLDAQHRLIAFSVVATGTANSCPVHPREIFQNAVLAGAVAIIVSHNHPSGDVTPSLQDKTVTQRLKAAGEILGIKVLDHLIVSDDAFYSFADVSVL
jgi:DNA repair protein RadC